MLKRNVHPDTQDPKEPIPPNAAADDPSEIELAVSAARGNQWAVYQLIRRYQDRAFAVAYRMSGEDAEQAHDITQDAFIKAFRRIDKFRGESSFYTWFYRILVNTCLDARKKKRRWARLFPGKGRVAEKDETTVQIPEGVADPAPSADPVGSLASRQFRRELDGVLARLPDRQRIAFELKIFEEMKLSDIAQVMKLETGTVKSHLFRATRAVRSALSHWARE